VISQYLQQWTAVQAFRNGEFVASDVWLGYLEMGGKHNKVDVIAYLAGMLTLPVRERDLVAHSINELIDEQGALVEGAHYSKDFVAEGSRFTAQARDRFRVSSSSIALITGDRQIIKSVIGPIGQDLQRDNALCSRTIKANRTLIITDATTDPDYRDHPLVTGGPHIRFYAGHPLSTADGWRIGTLCVIDDQPRSFTEKDALDLRILAGQVQLEILLGPADHHGN
jgi:GAF domain-containing protein